VTAAEPSSLNLAAAALSEAEENLVGLPLTAEVRDLQRRWYSLRTVVHGIVTARVPTITTAQESKLRDTVVSLAREVAEARRRLQP
jgi:hypothetical protein